MKMTFAIISLISIIILLVVGLLACREGEG